MNRVKDTLLVVLAVSTVALALVQYNTERVIAQAVQGITVLNQRTQPVPVVQVSKWEYRTDSCNGLTPECLQLSGTGLQGWELVAVSRGPSTPGSLSNWVFVFKRPKS